MVGGEAGLGVEGGRGRDRAGHHRAGIHVHHQGRLQDLLRGRAGFSKECEGCVHPVGKSDNPSFQGGNFHQINSGAGEKGCFAPSRIEKIGEMRKNTSAQIFLLQSPD